MENLNSESDQIVSFTACPEDFISYQSACYKFFKKYKKWSAASKFCQDLSATYHLVAINDNEENDFLLDHLSSNGDFTEKSNFWIGLKRTQNEYTWTDGNELEFGKNLGEDPWKNEQPDEVSYGYFIISSFLISVFSIL